MTALDTIKSAVLGNPFDPAKKPSRQGVIKAFSEMQAQLEGAQAGALVFGTVAAMNAAFATSALNAMAWVVSEPSGNNGIFQRTSVGWDRHADIPQFFISGMNTGEGTADAIEVTTDLPIPSQDGRALIGVQIIAANTIVNPTIKFNGGSALTIVNNAGNSIAIGGLTVNSFIVGFITAGTFRLISDQYTQAFLDQLQQMLDDATQLATPGDNTVTDPKVATPANETLGIKDFKLSRQHSLISSPAPIRSLQSYFDQGLTLVECASGPIGSGQDATAALQKLAAECANLGFTGRIGCGEFIIDDTVVFDEAGATSIDAPRGGLIGDGSGTIIRVASNITALQLKGGPSPGIAVHSRFGDFLLMRSGFAGDGIGISIDNYAWSDFERIAIYGFDIGILATDFLSSTLRRCTIRNNKRGMIANYADFSRPNALTFDDLELGQNSEFGAIITSPVTLNWIGGAVEGNGIGGTGIYGFTGGVCLINGGVEGTVGANMQNVYFEYNNGTADLRINHTSNDCVYSIEGCTFNRIDGTNYVSSNIELEIGGTAVVVAGIERCAFKGFNDYVESAARPYINVIGFSDNNLAVKVDDKTFFKSDTAYQDPAKWGTATRIGSITAAGTASFLPRDWSVIKTSTGVYTITHNLGTIGYVVSALTNTGSGMTVQRCGISANSFYIVTATPDGTLTDSDFVFTLNRV